MTSTPRIFMICTGAIFLIIAYLLYPASAGFTANEYISATGGISINNDQQWKDGDHVDRVFRGDNYHEGAAGQQITTGPGKSEFDTTTSLGADYRQTSELTYTGGAAIWDTLYSGSTVPNVSELACTAGNVVAGLADEAGSTPLMQSADGMTGAQGNSGRYSSDKYNAETDYALSSKFQGTGMYHGDLMADTMSGTDKNSTAANYAAEVKRHVFASSNLTGGIVGSIDWTMTDMSDPFNTTSNETAADEPVNQTGEEANLS